MTAEAWNWSFIFIYEPNVALWKFSVSVYDWSLSRTSVYSLEVPERLGQWWRTAEDYTPVRGKSVQKAKKRGPGGGLSNALSYWSLPFSCIFCAITLIICSVLLNWLLSTSNKRVISPSMTECQRVSSVSPRFRCFSGYGVWTLGQLYLITRDWLSYWRSWLLISAESSIMHAGRVDST